ncbi:MAG TPA: hypothetical protein VMF06_12310 [Candidatus Limnocylindria bacterium]|jgi:hypothetical protein|nr:hypothetical protein [Candidatus Limnocylindria bacterium]
MASGFIPLFRDRTGQGGPGSTTAKPGLNFRPFSPATAPSPTPIHYPEPVAIHPAVSAPSHGDPATSTQTMTPVITARKQGDRITHLIVRCPCGCVTEIECVY